MNRGPRLISIARQLIAERGVWTVVIVVSACMLATVSLVLSLNALLLYQRLPYESPNALVAMGLVLDSPRGQLRGNSAAVADQWQRVLGDRMELAVSASSVAQMRFSDEDSSLRTSVVSANFFSLLGRAPAQGAGFDRLGADERLTPTMILSHGLQRELFGERFAATERLTLDGVSYRVIGVMPEDFLSPRALRGDPEQAWVLQPAGGGRGAGRVSTNIDVFGRLKSGATREGIVAAADRTAAETLKPLLPPGAASVAISSEVLPLRDALIGESYKAAVALLATIMVFAALGTTIVSAMVASRFTRLGRSFAIRRVVGATTTDTLRHAALEMLLVMLVTVVLAGILSMYGTSLVQLLFQSRVARTLELRAGTGLLLIQAAVGFLFTLALCLPVLLRLRRGDLVRELQGYGARGDSRVGIRGRSILFGVQLYLISAALFISGVLLIGALERLTVGPGFTGKDARFLNLILPPPLREVAAKQALAPQIRDSLLKSPGVASVSLVDMPPLSTGVALSNVMGINGNVVASMQVNGVEPGYLGAVGLRLEAGRWFAPEAASEGAREAVVSTSAAALLGGAGTALNVPLVIEGNAYRVTGIVGDVRNPVVEVPGAELQVYLPFKFADPRPVMSFIVAPRDGVTLDERDISARIHAVGTELFVETFDSLGEIQRELVEEYRLRAWVSLAVLALSLLIAGCGAWALSRLTFDSLAWSIAVRMTVGATMHRLVRHVMKFTVVPALGAAALFGATAFVTLRIVADFSGLPPATVLALAAGAAALCVVVVGAISYAIAYRMVARDVEPVLQYRF